MKLESKLFLSYLLVVGVSLIVIATATVLLAPVTFVRQIAPMYHQTEAGVAEMPPMMMPGAVFEVIQIQFRAAINRSLVLAALAAIGMALLASWWLSQRIVHPVTEMVRASQRIAAGHYDERLTESHSKDELGELTRSFNRMAQALDDTEEMRQQLIADVSHELKTPLASIKGYMEGLQDGVIQAAPETYDLIHREATRLERLAHSLQELSRAEAAQLGIQPFPCDGAALVAATVEWLRPQFEDKGVVLEAELPASPPVLLADYDRIKQVLTNVLGNALQYTPPGGTVSIRLAKEGGQARFTVQDTGAGIPPEDLERIFQRFYRVDKSRARASGGSGIGLTIARHIVEQHGGRIWAESAGPGQGAAFHFTVPLG